MSKVTSKLQISIPKALAERYGIKPGDEIEFVPAGDIIRLETGARQPAPLRVDERLRLFDEATKRQQQRQRQNPRRKTKNWRGLTRDELNKRDFTR